MIFFSLVALNFHHALTKEEVRAEPRTNRIITRHETVAWCVQVPLKNHRHPTA